MTDVATMPDRPKPKRTSSTARGPALVSGIKLAAHFGVVRQHIDQLVQQGVIERRADGLFDRDASRLRYLAHLRAEHKRSPRQTNAASHRSMSNDRLRRCGRQQQVPAARIDAHRRRPTMSMACIHDVPRPLTAGAAVSRHSKMA